MKGVGSNVKGAGCRVQGVGFPSSRCDLSNRRPNQLSLGGLSIFVRPDKKNQHMFGLFKVLLFLDQVNKGASSSL